MNRIEYINKIVKYSALFIKEVEFFNSLNQYHINIHAESFLIPLLNEVFGISLENLNSTQKKNYPAIDLADFKNRVAFQITSTSSFVKLKHTLNTFFKYNLNKDFDVLYFYILTEKKEKYSDEKLDDIIPKDFVFSTNQHVLDAKEILKRIENINSTPKLESIARLYEHDFSEIQSEARKLKFQSGYLNNEPEFLSPNLIGITIPETLYKAEINIDEKLITDRINEYLVSIGKRRIKKFKKEKLIKAELRDYHAFNDDWVVFENWLYTFRNLHIQHEALNKIIDIGTITPIDSLDFYDKNDDYARVFKHLLRQTFIEFCRTKEIEWVFKKKIFRFANNRKEPSEKELRWKGMKSATRKVITEIRNKKENHLICYRSLAFRCSFINLSKEWFLVLNPTWSFTNPGGYRTSRYESSYMSGLKRIENNNSVHNAFRFLQYHLSYSDLFTTNYPCMKINNSMSIPMTPRIEEEKWNPPKQVEKVYLDKDVELSLDFELFDESDLE